MSKLTSCLTGCALMMATGLLGGESKNMIGVQSQNEGINCVPAPGKVTIDGSLEDWDWSGRIWIFADKNIRNRYSAEAAAMWDSEALYFAAKWKDPTPMFSTVNPDFNPGSGWKSDSIQMRISSYDQTAWITTWYHTPDKRAIFHHSVWKNRSRDKDGQEIQMLVSKPGETALGKGVEMAYKADADGKGFVQEMRIPWNMIFKQVPEVKPDLVFRMGLEFLWGDATGGEWPIHRYADNMQPGATSREFFWTATKAWGDVKLIAKGNIEPRQYVSGDSRAEGSYPITVEVPADAASFSVAIDDAQGRRVRNLVGASLPEDYGTATKDGKRILKVDWDCLDDNGIMVKPGQYKVRTISHKGLGSEYELCYYNPGTPPWRTKDGTGAWGADHCPPLRVAQAGERMIVSWEFAEGGTGINGIGADGLKKWGEKRGGEHIAADKDYVYAIPAGWHIKEHVVIRLDAKTGAYAPFKADGKELPFEFPLAQATGEKEVGAVSGITTCGNKLYLAFVPSAHKPRNSGNSTTEKPKVVGRSLLVALDKNSAKLISKAAVPQLSGIACNSKGDVYGIADKKIVKIDPASGKTTYVLIPGLGQPTALAFDGKDDLLVADMGPDSQVKAYANGKLVYTCGKKGGRPIRGKFDEQAMVKVSSVAADAKGDVWTVESWNYPRRVSVWNAKDGSLVRDYIGNTGYAGTGCFLHDTKHDLAYVGPIEIRLDYKTGKWKVENVLWVPDKEAGESFAVSTGAHAQPQRFTAEVNGKKHEYMFVPGYRDYAGYVIYMERNGTWQPVSAITTAGHVNGELAHHGQVVKEPSGELAGLNAYDSIIWNDTNGDGKVQSAECDVFPAKVPGTDKKRGQMSIPMGSGWGERISQNFVFYTNGGYAYKPVSFTDDGAPVYSKDSIKKVANLGKQGGDSIPVDQDNMLFLSWTKVKGDKTPYLYGVDTKTGNAKWRYPNPYPGVHGSHKATMPKPGLLIGPLKIAGIANVNDQVGKVFLMRGNLGQDFFMTTDGLYVGTMFQDGRVPSEQLPAKESSLHGIPMETFSNGGEPFNGWFGRHDDGKVRMTTGFPRQAAMVLQVKGLETIKRGKPFDISLSGTDIATADKWLQEHKAAAEKAKEYKITRLSSPKIDGNNREWKKLPELKLERQGSPLKGTAKIAYDDKNLYLLYEINDKSAWKNLGKDYTRLFKTGDAVDLQLNVNPATKKDEKRRGLNEGDVRILISQMDRKPVVVLTKPVDKTAPAESNVTYQSPVAPKSHDRVEIMKDAQVKVKVSGQKYVVEAAIPLQAIGLKISKGLTIRGDAGFISSDAAGQINTARTYWSNKNTNLVNDLPQESWLSPYEWGTFTFE